MADMGKYGARANSNAEQAAARWGEDKQAEAVGKDLAAIAYALLDVAHAIRQHTEARG
ncbi:hypothetical protein ACFRU3_42800 [Streptomyces sp. NPDC056910]|uniref:hypothetical protein n=1 Tax=Streptomyces sp. NPDC056910 TaxID=3345964 RepID=UPI0036882BCC